VAKKPAPTPPPPELALLLGDYYGTHDGCLYRITYEMGKLWQARCNCPAATPAADVFGDAYETTAKQLSWLLAFGCFIPATL
jgi:hypothetical protein